VSTSTAEVTEITEESQCFGSVASVFSVVYVKLKHALGWAGWKDPRLPCYNYGLAICPRSPQ